MKGADRLIPIDVAGGLGRGVPRACNLSAAAGRQLLSRWRMFDREFGLRREQESERVVMYFAKNENSIARLDELVSAESVCCSFVRWSVDDSEDDLRLVVEGTPEALSMLSI